MGDNDLDTHAKRAAAGSLVDDASQHQPRRNWLVVHVSNSPSGARLETEQALERASLQIGRGTDSDIFLTDPRLPLAAAVLSCDEDGLRLVAEGTTELEVNGKRTRGDRFHIGDRARIGPYLIAMVEARAPFEYALSIETVHPSQETPIVFPPRLRNTKWAQALSWCVALGLSLLVAIVFGLMPWLAEQTALPTQEPSLIGANVETPRSIAWSALWSTGELSDAHAFAADRCNVCHIGSRASVASEQCLACHQQLKPHHAATSHSAVSQSDCVACHEEHAGPESLARNSDQFCINCHGAELEGAASLGAVSGFPRGHPEFALRGAHHTSNLPPKTGSSLQRPKFDHSGINYAHKAHGGAVNGVTHPSETRWIFGCGDCHQADPNGTGFRQVSYARHCVQCHRISTAFGKPVVLNQHPQRLVSERLPHVSSELVRRIAIDQMLSLQASAELNSPDLKSLSLRSAPGSILRYFQSAISEAESRALEQDVADVKQHLARAANDIRFGKIACARCHEVSETLTADGQTSWRIEPVRIPDQWFSIATFNHNAHQQISCNHCHKATESSSARDILIPSLDLCASCHIGNTHDEPSLSNHHRQNRLRLRCVDCHQFHPPAKTAGGHVGK